MNLERLEELNRKAKILSKAAEKLHGSEKDLPRIVRRFLREIEEMEKKLKENE